MKGFKNTTKTKIGHSFPSNNVSVKSHTRAKPMCKGGKAMYADGGLVGHHDNPSKFAENMNWSDYKKGGKVKHPDVAEDKKLIKKELDKRMGHSSK